MSLTLEKKQALIFTKIYDRHSPSLFGVILGITSNSKLAEEILIQTFKTFFQENNKTNYNQSVFIQLLRTTIPIAAEKLDLPKNKLGEIIIRNFQLSKVHLAKNAEKFHNDIQMNGASPMKLN